MYYLSNNNMAYHGYLKLFLNTVRNKTSFITSNGQVCCGDTVPLNACNYCKQIDTFSCL